MSDPCYASIEPAHISALPQSEGREQFFCPLRFENPLLSLVLVVGGGGLTAALLHWVWLGCPTKLCPGLESGFFFFNIIFRFFSIFRFSYFLCVNVLPARMYVCAWVPTGIRRSGSDLLVLELDNCELPCGCKSSQCFQPLNHLSGLWFEGLVSRCWELSQDIPKTRPTI